jgi:protein-disulfide isomerase
MGLSKLCGLKAIFVVFALLATASAQAPKPSDTQGGITHEQADQILQELRQIRQLLAAEAATAHPPQAAPAAAQNAKINIAGLAVLGSREAPLTMVEFSDYQCPYCRAFHNGTFEEIKKNWIDTGKLRFVSWDLPLEFHSNAASAAQAARCAGEQNKFWEMRALLIANATKLEPDAVLGYAEQVPQLNVDRFKECVRSDRYSAGIRKAGADANSQGISGTPSFLIGRSNGDVVDGLILVGAQPFGAFDKQLKEQLPK